jgi:hypothetical protein
VLRSHRDPEEIAERLMVFAGVQVVNARALTPRMLLGRVAAIASCLVEGSRSIAVAGVTPVFIPGELRVGADDEESDSSSRMPAISTPPPDRFVVLVAVHVPRVPAQ